MLIRPGSSVASPRSRAPSAALPKSARRPTRAISSPANWMKAFWIALAPVPSNNRAASKVVTAIGQSPRSARANWPRRPVPRIIARPIAFPRPSVRAGSPAHHNPPTRALSKARARCRGVAAPLPPVARTASQPG